MRGFVIGALTAVIVALLVTEYLSQEAEIDVCGRARVAGL